MHRIPLFRSLIVATALFLIGAPQAHAELQMGSQIGNPTIAVGDSTYIVVQVAGVAKPSQPRIEVEKGDASGIRSQFASTGSQVFRSGNDVQQVHSFRFTIVGLKTGDYTLTAAIDHEGQTFGTDPMKLKVRPMTDAEKANEPKFTIAPDKNEIYVGELLPLKLIITTSPRTAPEFHNVTPEVESNGFVMQPLRGLFRAGIDAEGNDRHFFEGWCEALRAGDLTLGPATYPMVLAIRDRGFGRSSRKRYNLTSEPVTIKVKPLPSAGKPESFTGSVGSFKMDIEAAPLTLKQGEPISVTLSIVGEGNLPSIDAPTLTGDTAAWKLYDPNRADSRDENRNRRNPMAPVSNSGRVTFTQMIVPLETKEEIPPFEFSFFDPETGSYRTLRTDAIPINVSADPNAVATGSTSTSGGTASPQPEPVPNVPPPVEEMTDILSIREAGDQEWRTSRTPLAQSKLFWALQAPPAVALLGLVFVALGRHRNGRETEAAWAGTYPPCAEIMRKLEAAPDDERAFYQLTHEFIEAWEEQHPKNRTAELAPELAAEVATIRERHNFLSFGGASGSDTNEPIDRDRRREVIRTLQSLSGHA